MVIIVASLCLLLSILCGVRYTFGVCVRTCQWMMEDKKKLQIYQSPKGEVMASRQVNQSERANRACVSSSSHRCTVYTQPIFFIMSCFRCTKKWKIVRLFCILWRWFSSRLCDVNNLFESFLFFFELTRMHANQNE